MKMHGRATTTIPESLFFDYSNYQAPLTKKNQLISYALPNTLPRTIFRLWQLPLSSNLKNHFSSNRSLKNQPKALLKRSPSPSKYLPTNTQKSLTSHSLLPQINEYSLFQNISPMPLFPLNLLKLNSVILSSSENLFFQPKQPLESSSPSSSLFLLFFSPSEKKPPIFSFLP